MKNSMLFLLFGFLSSAILIVYGCTKEGPPGPPGQDGKDGADGNAICITCHTIAKKNSVTAEYKKSVHYNSHLMYNGQTVYQFAGEGPEMRSCTGCHSEQGFVSWQYSGVHEYPDTNGLQTAYPIGCIACHDSHETYDFENDGPDYALRTSDPVKLLMYSNASPPEDVEINFGENSNLCVNCHQPLDGKPKDDGTGQFTITSIYWGPHSGPQSTTLQGIGAFEAGSGYPVPGSSPHRQEMSCILCHMHDPSAGEDSTGGHTFNVPLHACTACHPDATDFDVNGTQTLVSNLMNQLKQKFIENNMWDTQNDCIIPGTYPINRAGAYYNYEWVLGDRSKGVHNPDYIKTLLENSIAVFN